MARLDELVMASDASVEGLEIGKLCCGDGMADMGLCGRRQECK
jgi:hypothetical protein